MRFTRFASPTKSGDMVAQGAPFRWGAWGAGHGELSGRGKLRNSLWPPSADRPAILEGIGRGIGRAAAHEFAHQLVPQENIHASRNPESYEYESAERVHVASTAEQTRACVPALSRRRRTASRVSKLERLPGTMMRNFRRSPTLRLLIVRERWRASRLPSLRSALRGLDPRHALPTCCGIYRSVATNRHQESRAIGYCRQASGCSRKKRLFLEVNARFRELSGWPAGGDASPVLAAGFGLLLTPGW